MTAACAVKNGLGDHTVQEDRKTVYVVREQLLRLKKTMKKPSLPPPLVTVCRTNPTEIIRCLLHDGLTLEGAVRYCRTISLNARYGAYAAPGDAEAYEEAGNRLEARIKEEKLSLDHVNELETLCNSLARHIIELQETVVKQQEEIERLKPRPATPPDPSKPAICTTCNVHPVDEFGWCATCGNYTCLKCGVAMYRRDLQRPSAGFQCPKCNSQKFG